MALPYNKNTRLTLAQERGILVDPSDTWLLEEYTWLIHRTGYVATWVMFDYKQLMVYLHHCIIGFPIWGHEEVDHIDQDKLNNRRSNLRITTEYVNKQNSKNVQGKSNVYFREDRGWFVKIQRNGKGYQSQAYPTEQEAIADRDAWLNTQHGD